MPAIEGEISGISLPGVIIRDHNWQMPGWWGNSQLFINNNQRGGRILGGNIPAGGLNPDDSFLHDYYDSGSKVKSILSAIALVASKSKVTEVARIGEFASVPLFISAEVMDYYAWKGGEISGAKALLNLGMGLVGFTEIGAPISAAYFAGDAFIPGGWSGLGKSISNGINDTLDQLKQGVSKYNNPYQWVPHQ